MMKKKKTDFEARFWSGTRKHSVTGLLEAFFQFNDLAVVKEALSAMVQCSVRRKARLRKCPEEVFHLYLSLRSLVRAGRVMAGKSKEKQTDFLAAETHVAGLAMGSLSEEEFRDPVRVFRKSFRKFSREDYDGFLSSLIYFSLGSSKGEENRKVIGPYLHLIKMLEAVHLLVERGARKE